VLPVTTRAGDTLLLQYRTRTREVLRVGYQRVVIINERTHRVTRLPDAATRLATVLDAGYLHADIEYDGLNLAGNNYRVEGRITVFLAGRQQSRNFRAYLDPDPAGRPPDSSIDWGMQRPATRHDTEGN
jgi:hypothetical protein